MANVFLTTALTADLSAKLESDELYRSTRLEMFGYDGGLIDAIAERKSWAVVSAKLSFFRSDVSDS